MLKAIHLRDFAIVDAVNVELDGRMTVFTGETGAGKSILIEALGLALGERADATAVRQGASRAVISAEFDLSGVEAARAFLAEQALDAGPECIVRRQLNRDGRSRAFINDTPVAVQTLRGLGERLVDIYGQNTHQSLVRREVQRALLDEYGAHEDALEAVRAAHAAWRQARERLRSVAPPGDAEQQADYLRHQLGELEAMALEPEALEALEQEHRRLAHGAELIQGAQTVLGALTDEQGPQSNLERGARQLRELARFEPALAGVAELLEAAAVSAAEAGADLARLADRFEADPARLDELERQISALQALARKHRVAPEGLLARRDELAARLSALEAGAGDLERLEQALQTARSAYEAAARRLGEARRATAPRMNAAISERLQELGMPGAALEVSLEDEPGEPSPHGGERVSFLVRTNPGQPLMPLSRVASGGEVARISLAIQVAVTSGRSVATLVFDEVDVGVGGRVAEMVGRHLRALGARRQVLCVTHLPQVAVQAHAHLQVRKLTGSDSTRTELTRLEGEGRVEEVGRMLGGVELTEETLNHARAMLNGAQAQP